MLKARKALNASDLDGIVNGFTEDGVLMPMDQPIVLGRDNIRKVYESRLGMFNVSVNVDNSVKEIVAKN